MRHRSILIKPPRSILPQERAILDNLLSANFPGKQMLQKQAASALVSEECEDCKTIKLVVDHVIDNAAEVKRRIPIEAEADDVDGKKIHFLLHVVNGFIDELEIFREDSNTIKRFPESKLLTLINLDE
jgi:hypothetical protein